jgi:hypothetical protein
MRILALVLTLCAAVCHAADLREVLESHILETVEFNDTSLPEAIDWLNQQITSNDTALIGWTEQDPNITYAIQPSSRMAEFDKLKAQVESEWQPYEVPLRDRTLTLRLRRINAMELVRLLADVTRTHYVFEGDQLIFTSGGPVMECHIMDFPEAIARAHPNLIGDDAREFFSPQRSRAAISITDDLKLLYVGPAGEYAQLRRVLQTMQTK